MATRTLASTAGSVLDAVGTGFDVITKTADMIGNVVEAGHSYTQVWRENAKERAIIAIAEAIDVAQAEASHRHVDRMKSVNKLSEEEQVIYGQYVQKLQTLRKLPA